MADSSPPQATDVLIIGAGIIGLASAHALAERGASVRIVERSRPGAGESTRTGGGIRLAHGSETNVRLTELSMPTWTGFAAITGVDPGYRETGHLFLATGDETGAQLRSQAELLGSLDVPFDLLAGDEIASRWPPLAHLTFDAASFCTIGGYLDQHLVIQGYVAVIRSAGGIITEGTAVTGLIIEGDRVGGVTTQNGTFSATHVVNAAGPHAGTIAAFAGLDVPFVSRRHELLVVRPERPVPEDIPWLIDVDAQVHMRPDGDGRALVGGFLGEDEPADPDSYETTVSPDWSRRVRAAAARSFGLVEDASAVVDGWAGLYPGTLDYQPVLEISSPGLITAAGFSGTGLMHAPAVGRIVADLVVTGATDLMDITALGSDRFRSGGRIVDRTGF